MWFSLFLVGSLLLGGFLVVVLAIGSAGMSLGSSETGYVEEATLRDNDSKNKIAVIDLAGLIASFQRRCQREQHGRVDPAAVQVGAG